MTSVLKSLYLKAFPLFERLGVHITPRHYTQPIPDTAQLDPAIWQRQSSLVGIDMREADQVALLESFREAYRAEYDEFVDGSRPGADGFSLHNPFFGPVDAEVLYCMIRRWQPRRVVEVGSGFSTLVGLRALAATAREGGRSGRIESYDPYPSPLLTASDPPHAVRAVAAERIPLDVFESLEEDDVLFIDSTHVVKIGGDVVYLFLEVLPRLRPGVVVHVHDIFMPCDYPKDWIYEHRLFWTEQYLLQAFLAFNDAFAVLWAAGFMQARHADALARAFASYDHETVRPGSFWMRRERSRERRRGAPSCV